MPADWNIEKVFKSQCIDLATPEEKKELQVLSGVKGEQTWFKHTPTSEQERYAEMVCILDIARMKDETFAEEAWKAELVPMGEFVSFDTGVYFFVVRTYPKACVLWPATKSVDGIFEIDLTCTELTIRTVFDVSLIVVQRCTTASPLHLKLSQLKSTGISRVAVGDPLPLQLGQQNK